jgi:excisionase family DNA binding protein
VPQYITVKDIMSLYKCSKSTVYNWIDEGLPVYKFGKMTRFIEPEVEKWLKSKQKQSGYAEGEEGANG